jgi:serine/threonine-protein kinase
MVFCPTDGTSLRMDEVGGDLIGSVIADRYLVGKLLGEGGMGKVYLATHVRLPQKAAIKVLHHDMVKDAGAVARFNREAANAARIEHDRVARVFDYGETSEGLVYIAMEFVPGKTLRDLLDDEGRMTPVRAANIVYQVAEGLDAAHKLSIVHRDLKPDNILVITDESGVDRCKVVDFGIAKKTNDTGTQLTQMGMLVGTPDYMSPEQVLGEQLDGRSDVYALALVAYELFSGEVAFDGATPERKLTARLIQDPRPLADVVPDIEWPSALQAAFDHALVREPEGRTASALEFGDAIVNAVEAWTGLSVLRARTPMSTPAILSAANESTSSLARPTPVSSSATSSRAPAPAATPTSARAATPGAGTSASKPAIPEPKPKSTPWAAIAGVVLLIGAAGSYFAFGGEKADDAVPPAAGTSTDTNSVVPTPPAGATANKPAAPRTAAPNVASNSAPPVSNGTSAPPATTAPVVPRGISIEEAAAAHTELESIRNALTSAPDGTEPAAGTRAIPQLTQLLPRLVTQTDSAWAYIALTTAHGYVERPDRACEPYRLAKRLATTAAQRATLDGLAAMLTCAP